MIRGRSLTIACVAYTDEDNSIVASLSGAEISMLLKASHRDLDINALITKATIDAAIIDADAGTFEMGLLPSDTINLRAYSHLFFEIVVILSTGAKISSGLQKLELIDNVIHE